jgi:two-component system, cell cycle sensor histidine kinase and response regulator CckA
MSAATPFPVSELSGVCSPRTEFRSIFEHAPIAAACCDSQGVIVEMNPAFKHALRARLGEKRLLRLFDLIPPQDYSALEPLMRDLLDASRDSIRLQIKNAAHGLANTNWTVWCFAGASGEPSHALLIAEPNRGNAPAEESLIQSQRWEAVGRLAGGVVHDFNNLLTGVMLYCDLLLSALDLRDRRRRYADEIRAAIVQAGGLVQQLLVFARPQTAEARALCLNRIAVAMQELLTRLIGENISLDLRLDPDLGLVKIDQAQAQQIFLNLVLNARDALPNGGRIIAETRNCEFQTVPRSMPGERGVAFPCVLLVVSDNGHGMDAKTRQRLFEPFFTTKSSGKGTGLGLTTVRSIVTTNRGLIHIESDPGSGTRVMILLPRASQHADPEFLDPTGQNPEPLQTPLQETKKELLL